MNNKFFFLAVLCLCPFLTSAQNLTPEEAHQKLVDGNNRFVSGNLINTDRSMERVKELTHGQHPYAIIVGCSDSRVPPEIIFDEGLGNLFVIRLAGEVVNEYALGSIEYAAKYLSTPLIFVLAHSECGAVHAAVEAKDYGTNINSIVEKISPAVEKARAMSGDLMENAVKENMLIVKSELENAPELKKLVDEGKLKITSGIYHLDSGKVKFNN